MGSRKAPSARDQLRELIDVSLRDGKSFEGFLAAMQAAGHGNAGVVITSHSGYTTDTKAAFAHVGEVPDWKRKGFRVSDDAPYNPYR